MSNRADVEMLNNSIQYAGESALKRRQIKQQGETDMERVALQQQMEKNQEARANAAHSHWNEMETTANRRADAAENSADWAQDPKNPANKNRLASADLKSASAAAKKRPFYIYAQNDKTGNAFQVAGTFDDADKRLEALQSSDPDKGWYIATNPPKNKVQRPSPDGNPDNALWLDDEHAAQYDERMASANKAHPTPPPRLEVHTIKNPERVVNGVVNTNVPATMSMTNTVNYPKPPPNMPAPNTNGTPQAAKPSDVHVQYLLAHPNTAPFFDQKFGQGAASQFLKQP